MVFQQFVATRTQDHSLSPRKLPSVQLVGSLRKGKRRAIHGLPEQLMDGRNLLQTQGFNILAAGKLRLRFQGLNDVCNLFHTKTKRLGLSLLHALFAVAWTIMAMLAWWSVSAGLLFRAFNCYASLADSHD